MKIIILGAGQVGGNLAEQLASEDNDITLVDTDTEHLRELGERLDVRTLVGHASYPNVLQQAGADDADMLVAVTNSDEINMVACQVAHSLFRTPKKIARIRADQYIARDELFAANDMPIDVLFSPEQVVTHHIKRLIEHPGTLQVMDFAEGKAQLVCVRARYGGLLVGQKLRQLRQHLPNADIRVAAIFRRDRPIIPTGDTTIETADEVFFIADRKRIRAMMTELRRVEKGYRHVVIAGGGQVGERLAEAIEKHCQVKLIETNLKRCEHLASSLDSTLVLHGNASDRDLLLEESIDRADLFIAVTNDDDANIMSSLLAKRMGARKAMAIINNPAYLDLMQGGEIDIVISPQLTSLSVLLTHVRRGDVASVHSLRRGAAEAIEAIARGDKKSSKVVGRKVADIPLPPGSTIGAVIRDDDVLVVENELEILSGDHVILFVVDKKHIPAVERLFQVGLSFF